jgi:AraC family transcriptional regulator, transcriptional activator FtrA
MHRVAIPVTDGMPAFELGVPCEVFGPQEDFTAPWWYEMRLCAGQCGPVRVAGGLRLDTDAGLEEIARADTVIMAACGDVRRGAPAELLDALRAAHARGARIASLCTGAFILAEAGLLDGRPATTHWRHAAEFARRWPHVQLDPCVLYTDDGQILTSAGSAAALDLCLYMVRRDHGTRVANALARRLVMPPHRDGGQAQYVERAVPESRAVGLAPVLDWARGHLDEPLTVDDLAAQAAMSPRTFARHFKAATGTTPLQWLLAERVRRARELLEATDDTIDRVAARCGFGSAQQLRTHFSRASLVSPHEFRRTFRAVTSDRGAPGRPAHGA